ncbi:MAG: 1-phosphofructokinase [Wujia sp.]
MVYTVTFNPSLDYIVDVTDVVMGEVNRTSHENILPGGKGINMAVVLNHFGVDTRAVAFTAGFTGEALKNLLQDRNINSDFIDVNEGMTRINVKVRSNGETEINGKGPVITQQSVGVLYEKLDYLDSEDYLILAGSIPASLPDTTYMEIMERLDYKKINIIVDAEKNLVLKALPYRPFLVKPNIHELGDMFDVTISGKDDIYKYAGQLMEKGARNVLVSMGGDGAILFAEDGQVYEAAAPKGDIKNSVGAGDAMVAGFLAGYIQTGDYGYAFKLGVCSGSASAFSEEYATKEDALKLLKENFK